MAGLKSAAEYPRLIVLCVLAIGISLVLTGCNRGPQVMVTLADNNSTVEVPRGGRLVLTLDTNPSKKFLWVVDQLDQSILEYDRKELVTLEQESRFGGHSFRQFIFKAVKPGKTSLNIDLDSLSDEDEGFDLETFWLTVNVTE